MNVTNKKTKEFIDYVCKCDIEWSLEATCKLLLNAEEEALQNAWISLLARAGEIMNAEHVKVWLHVAENVLQQVQQDYLDATEVMTLTVMLCCLFRRLKGRKHHSLQLQTLRSKIIHYFPTDAELTEKGLRTYARILPTRRDDDAYDFAQKLLVGLTRLWSDSLFEDSRLALEYLTRRKIMMELPEDFPCELDLQDGNMIWFLWCALLCYSKDHEHVRLLWSLFSWDWKKNLRADRIGLLWGASWSMHPNAHQTVYWTPQEMQFLDMIKALAMKLWTDFVAINRPNHDDSKNGAPVAGQSGKAQAHGKAASSQIENANARKVDLLLDFTPRVSNSNRGSTGDIRRHHQYGGYSGYGYGSFDPPMEQEIPEERGVIEVRNDKRATFT